MARAKVMLPTPRVHEYTVSAAPATYASTYMEHLEAGRHLHLHGALSREGAVYTDIYTDSSPWRDGVYIKSTPTSTPTSSTSPMRRRGEAILHRHVLLR
jgi:hypothetical protein